MNKQDFNEIKEKFEKDSQKKKISRWLNYLSILIATLGAAIITSYMFDTINPNVINKIDNSAKIQELENQIIKLKSELIVSKNAIDSLKISKLDGVTSNLNSEVETLQRQISTLNKVILDNPEKAISVPLLKIEIQNQKDQNEKEINSIKDDIARVYDINKWIIGLVFTMLVSIIILNISNLFLKNKKE
jgi:ribosomal protein L29